MEYVTNSEAFDNIVWWLFSHYKGKIDESINKFVDNGEYISGRMVDFLILEEDFIKIYAVDPENFEGVYVMEYKFQPFDIWHEIATFNR